MRRYRLKRDLPTFKAGETFYIGGAGHLYADNTNGYAEIVAYSAITLRKFPNILRDWFEQIPANPKTVWDLEIGDLCYVLMPSPNGFVYAAEAQWNSKLHSMREIGYVFLTAADATREIERRKAEVVLRRDANGFVPSSESEWRSRQVYWDYRESPSERLDVSENYGLDGSIYFKSREEAWKSINKHYEEWLKYFGIEEKEGKQ